MHRHTALIAFILTACLFPFHMQLSAQVTKVHILFKTHLDIGFTDLSSAVEKNYVENFIPKAMDVADALRQAGGEERYIWTTGSWLIQAFMDQASPSQQKRLETAIQRGDIVWNAMPYTVESESLNKEQFFTLLQQAKMLDRRFGKRTIGAKMTDVPGHTRGIVPLLADAGIRFLHIGVNPASTVPSVPPICRWRAADGSEIILMYQADYGSDTVLPDGKTAVMIAFTGDNHGPHSVEQVKAIYATLHQKYPKAKLVASTLDQVAADLEKMSAQLPVVTAEIGDTWIYGYGSSPVRMASFRKLARLYTQWVEKGQIDPAGETAIHYMTRLGMIAEHTWGVDVKTHLHNWSIYNVDDFNAARTQPAFQKAEKSWQELSDNIHKAIELLPTPLKAEATQAIAGIEHPQPPRKLKQTKQSCPAYLTPTGSIRLQKKGISLTAGELSYQTFSAADYERFFKNYMTHPYGWAFQDFGKPGLDKTKAASVTIQPKPVSAELKRNQGWFNLAFTPSIAIDQRILPEQVQSSYRITQGGRHMTLTLTLWNKPANRLPEAYWYSFVPESIDSIWVDKMGERISALDVVAGGNRQMHGIDRYVEIKTTKGLIRISSPDAPLVTIGERNALNYSTQQPDIRKGIHFCLFNNLWGTNFSQWFEGSITYHFDIELIPGTNR